MTRRRGGAGWEGADFTTGPTSPDNIRHNLKDVIFFNKHIQMESASLGAEHYKVPTRVPQVQTRVLKVQTWVPKVQTWVYCLKVPVVHFIYNVFFQNKKYLSF